MRLSLSLSTVKRKEVCGAHTPSLRQTQSSIAQEINLRVRKKWSSSLGRTTMFSSSARPTPLINSKYKVIAVKRSLIYAPRLSDESKTLTRESSLVSRLRVATNTESLSNLNSTTYSSMDVLKCIISQKFTFSMPFQPWFKKIKRVTSCSLIAKKTPLKNSKRLLLILTRTLKALSQVPACTSMTWCNKKKSCVSREVKPWSPTNTTMT